MVVGAWCEGIGLALRLGVRQNLHSTGLYIAQYLFVVLSVSVIFPRTSASLRHVLTKYSPALSWLVSPYVPPAGACGRLTEQVITYCWVESYPTLTPRTIFDLSSQPGCHGRSSSPTVSMHSAASRNKWTLIDIVITFLIQAAGGGLSTSTDPKQAQTGGNIFLAGIAAQMASFTLFSGMWILFIVRV